MIMFSITQHDIKEPELDLSFWLLHIMDSI
jgi:hypothetical protein